MTAPHRVAERRSPRREPTVRIEQGDAALGLVDDRWDELVRRQRVPNPTLTATWLHAVARHEPGVPLVVVVDAGDRLLAAGAFALRRPLGRRSPCVATWLGDAPLPPRLGDVPLVMSPDLLVDRTARRAGQQIAQALLDEAVAVHLSVMPLAGAAAEALLDRAPWLSAWRSDEAWVAEVAHPGLGRHRKEAAYHQRRAERLGAKVEVACSEEPDMVRVALERLFDLYERRWRGRDDELARFGVTEELRDWYRSLTHAMACRGEAKVVEVFEDEEPVAGLLGFVFGRGALMHSTAAQPGARLKRPGHTALLAFVDAAHAAGATVVDLGRGAGEPGGPKADLYPTRVPMAGMFAARSWALQHALEVPLVLRGRFKRIAAERRAPR